MTELRFSWILEDRSTNSPWETYGPLFTRWLPNGEEDAINLNLDTLPGTMHLWFARYGSTDSHGFIRFDYKKHDVDESIMQRQGILEAGPVLGKVLLDYAVPDVIQDKIEKEVKNDADVIAFIKPIVKEINHKLILFIEVLKYRYGQYWLPSVDKWDSRIYPLGVYCKYHLQLKLFNEKDRKLSIVVPDDETQTVQFNSIIRKSFPEYLTEEDWRQIQQNLPELNKEYYLNKIIINSYKGYLDGEYHFSVVFGCTALELAIEHYYDKNKLPEKIRDRFTPFQNMPLRTQVIAVLLSSGAADKAELFLYFIDLRNKIVHEGHEQVIEYEYSYKDFLECIGKYFIKREIKLPNANHGNILL